MATVRHADNALTLRRGVEAAVQPQPYTATAAVLGDKPAWMVGVPTPFTRAACATGTENEPARPLPGRCGSSSEVLSSQLGPPIQQVLDLGGLPPVLSLLTAESAAVQLQAAWVVTNVASGSSAHAAAVIEAGGLPAIFSALQSPAVPERAELCSQLLWVLGNIAGDKDSRLRDKLLEAEVVGHIGQLFAQIPGFTWDKYGRTQVLRTLTWLMSCLCGGLPAPKLEEVDCAFDYFAQVLTGTDDMEMSSEALWGLHHLLDGATSKEDVDARITRMLSAGFGPGEAALPNAPHPVIAQVASSLGSFGNRKIPTVAPAMKILGALLRTKNSENMDLVLAAGVLKALGRVLADTQSTARLRQDAAAALAAVAAGTRVQKLLDEPGTYKALQGALERGPTPEVRRECAWAVANLARQGSPVLSRTDCKELLRLLSLALKAAADPALQRVLLEGVEAVLSHSAKQAGLKCLEENPLAEAAETFGLIETLEELQHSESESTYRKAVQLLERFFGADGENKPPEAPITPAAGKRPVTGYKSPTAPSSICGGSPVRPGYKFGA